MRRTFFGIALATVPLALWPLSTCLAQHFVRTTPQPSVQVQREVRPGPSPSAAGRNPIRPYTGDQPAVSPDNPKPGRWSTRSVARESSPPKVAASHPSRNYFSGLRAGQGANRNVINPRSLCVPGRRALLVR